MTDIVGPSAEGLVRPATQDDLRTVALLCNGVREPHFHTAASRLDMERVVVCEHAGRVVGALLHGTRSFDRPDRCWLELALDPDHRDGAAARQLLDVDALATATSLWASVREDYLPTWPNLRELGFREVHRTFGGGVFLSSPERARLVPARGVELVPLESSGTSADDLDALVAAARADQLVAPPTITASSGPVDRTVVDLRASHVAVRDGRLVGCVVVEPSGLGAWLDVLTVVPDERARGTGAALLAAARDALARAGVGFLNAAGVTTDAAFLATLRRVGANVEPDWIAFERTD